MKKAPASKIGRKRRTLGWTILTLGLVVAGVWFASRWLRLDFSLGSARSHCLTQGVLVIPGYPDPSCPPWSFQLRSAWRHSNSSSVLKGWCWRSTQVRWINWESPDLQVTDLYVTASASFSRKLLFLVVVLWPIPLLLCPPGGLLLRSGIIARRRAMTGKCRSCGYNLTGLGPDAKCPECGK